MTYRIALLGSAVLLAACSPTTVPAGGATTNPSAASVDGSSPADEAPAETPASGDSSPTSPVSKPSPTGNQLYCSFFWRKSVRRAHSGRKELDVRDGGSSFALRDFDFEVSLGSNAAGGKVMQVEAKAGGSVITSSYDFGVHAAAAHLPPGGHGFTGLQYLTHPTSGAEVQFFCGADDGKPRDEFAIQASPGPAAPKDARVQCEAAAFDDGGETAREHFTLEPAGKHTVEDVGGFTLSVEHMTSETEGADILIDASAVPQTTDAPTVHTMYQVGAGNLPSNILADPSFTGVRSLVAPSGKRLEYRCWVEA